jgi:hypothetical protein
MKSMLRNYAKNTKLKEDANEKKGVYKNPKNVLKQVASMGPWGIQFYTLKVFNLFTSVIDSRSFYIGQLWIQVKVIALNG